ncbi:3-oxo-5a-steroid 4- dehydrogenase [Kickxella alabastrina]|uniref:3-oxo-5a-steroid 4- dehydrogenase n=1 Tax=Kickxella alabastrina TaxID=61397 RepID=A0ACC1I736_9FUNG|nr:3-oxo-5a-steroid 4- dehydrogenase [Kickxella alabastrina]
MRISIAKRSASSAKDASNKAALPSPSSSASSRYPFTVEVSDNATVDDLKAAIASNVKSMYPDRQRLTFGDKKTVLESGDSLSKYGVSNDDTVFIKDLGPQIGWQTVFYIEYLGPIIFHYIVYNFPRIFYGVNFEHSEIQRRVYLLVMAHFVKRELETAFVHRFSHGTMPLMNVFKNSFHYHMLSGLNLAYWVYAPASGQGTALAAKLGNPLLMAIFTGVFLFAELSNLSTHITLRNLRPPGTRVRRIPHGYGFDMVSCPNYLFESLAWVAIAAMTRNLAAVLFLIVSSGQMYMWAIKKHKQYRREFPDYPKSRKAMIPLIV